MVNVDNREKYLNYKNISERISLAMRNKYFFEAIFLQYAIMEDRLAATLVVYGVNIYKKDKEISISCKIKKLKLINDKYREMRLTDDFLDSIMPWIKERNKLIHLLMINRINMEDIEKCALRGNEIIKTLKNKSQQIICHIKKKQTNL